MWTLTRATWAIRVRWADNMICALCKQDRELRCSHFIPKFVYRWQKESSGTGYLRFSQSPNQRVQDGFKKDFLCADCESLFEKFETEFANKIFYPLHQNESLRMGAGPWFNYKSWCMKFSVSVSWRCLMLARDLGLSHFSEAQRLLADEALETWRLFLLDKIEHPGAFEQHMVLFDHLAHHTCHDLPPNFNRYMLRIVELQPIRTDGNAFIYVKMCRVMIFGFIQETEKKVWNGTKLHVRNGQVGSRNFTMPNLLLKYFKQRASVVAKMEKNLSPRQHERILKDSEQKLERVLGSETLQAQLYDYEMFGPSE
jgi:hypothetical protein